MEQILGFPLPVELAEFYRGLNGASLFSDSLSIYGLRTSHDRTNARLVEPYGIETANSYERLKGAPRFAVFMGFYANDGSHLYMDADQGMVHHCGRFDPRPLHSWLNLHTMLESEIRRISTYFLTNGERKGGVRGSAPPPSA